MFLFDLVKISDNPTSYQLRTKTITYRVDFDNKNQENIFVNAVGILQSSNPSLSSLIQKLMSNGSEKKDVLEVLSILRDANLLPEKISEGLKVKENNSKESPKLAGFIPEINKRTKLVLFGSGELFKTIQQAAETRKIYNVQSYEYKTDMTEAQIEKIVSSSDFCIVDATEWAPYHLEIINQMAIKHNKPWLYVGGIEGPEIRIGPFFYGAETGCYNCLIGRVKSNQDNFSYLENYEQFLKEHKLASKPDIPFNKDIIYGMASNLIMLETTKIIEGWSIPSTWKAIISINYISLEIRKESLLKLPYCEVCNPKVDYNVSPWLDEVTLRN